MTHIIVLMARDLICSAGCDLCCFLHYNLELSKEKCIFAAEKE